MALNKLLASILCLVLFNDLQAQKGKDGVKTVSTANVKINEFTALTAPVAANSTILNVTSNALNTNARFTTTLTPGDLVMIIQMQGADITNNDNNANEYKHSAFIFMFVSISLNCYQIIWLWNRILSTFDPDS